ncbi:MAG: hypothetical protein IJP64_00040 [Oscillospiraceae bacterium]|nr:hypothetical protein [Oscillospiraceae bacterium]
MMRMLKKCLCLLVALAMLLPLVPGASAEDEDDARFAGKSWQEIMEEFFAAHGTNTAKVACGWCNTVTGEEQYFNGDQYMVSGSMYKVPMNMIFAEKVHNGEIGWNTFVGAYRYEYAIHATIVDSNNDVARSMWEYLGGYQPYRHLLAPYMGEDPDTVDEKFYENNFSTPRQMIYALELLATESERFPRVIDEMLQAEPHKYFKLHEHTVDIAHKYGYFTEGSRLYLNDCAILFTEEPVCIVLFTDTVVEPYKLLADFCDLMIDYTNYSTAARLEAERIAAEEAAIAALNSPSPVPEETAAPAPSEGQVQATPAAVLPTAAPEGESESFAAAIGRIVLILLIAFAACVLAVRALEQARKGKMKLTWALAAIVLAAAALVICVLPQRGAAKKEAEEILPLRGDPQQTVTEFFNALAAQDYQRANKMLYGVSTLGLERAPQTEDAAAVWHALEAVRNYKLYGDCAAVSGGAVQQLVYTTLDLDALSQAVKAGTEAKVEELAASLPADEIYDGEGGYLASFTERAYSEALEAELEHVEDYCTLVGLNIRLVRSGDDWLIEPDDALYGALTGGLVG